MAASVSPPNPGSGAARTNTVLSEIELGQYIQGKKNLVAKIFLIKEGENWKIDNTAANISGSISLTKITPKSNITEIQGQIMQILNNDDYEAETIMIKK